VVVVVPEEELQISLIKDYHSSERKLTTTPDQLSLIARKASISKCCRQDRRPDTRTILGISVNRLSSRR
jgi:hypothetical protein